MKVHSRIACVTSMMWLKQTVDFLKFIEFTESEGKRVDVLCRRESFNLHLIPSIRVEVIYFFFFLSTIAQRFFLIN